MDVLRFITAGNVDDGKSTLIGRLLYDTGNIKDDILQTVGNAGDDAVNLAHITDGLRSERAQGITIDVAYKYFVAGDRKYIITDAPGHFQYTKNLVTGASNVDIIIMLIDANNGITEQTRRHSLVASFLNIPRVIVAVNKMDAVNYSEEVFTAIKDEYRVIADKLQLRNVSFVPVSALCGDNVISPSGNMGWYKGETLMSYLAGYLPIAVDEGPTRFSVQYILNSTGAAMKQGYAGKLLSGKLRTGDRVCIYPEMKTATISHLSQGNMPCAVANAGDNISVYLDDGAEAVRGDLLHGISDLVAPQRRNRIEATICWLDDQMPLANNGEYILRINAFETICRVTRVVHKIDLDTLDAFDDDKEVDVNKFARVMIETSDMVAFDPYSVVKETGRGVLIDRTTNYTSAALIIEAEQQ